MAEYGPVDANDDPMKKKSSFGELVSDAKDSVKEKAKAEKEGETAKPRNIFEMFKSKGEQNEDEVSTNPFLEALRDNGEGEEDETDIFGRKVNAEKDSERPEESAEVESEADGISSAVETEGTIEATVETVELEGQEVAEVAVDYAESTAQDAQNELTDSEPGSLEEVEAAASLAFAEALKEQAGKDQEMNEASIEQAAQLAAAELDISDGEQDESDLSSIQTPESEDLEPDPSEANMSEQVESEYLNNQEAEPTLNNQEATGEESTAVPEINMKDDNEEDTSLTPPANTAAPLQQPYGTSVVAGPNIYGGNINAANTLNPASLNTIEAKTLSRRSASRGALVGGAVGYMVGRRRGRIKTEEKLLPVQKKLEKQVSDLHDQLTDQEMKLRRRAAIFFEQNRTLSLKQLEKIQEMREKKLDHHRTQEAVRSSAAEQNTASENRESVERVVEYKSESNENVLNDYERQVSEQSAEAMTIPLLLSLAETIVIGETSLRTMYERGSINQNQLRRVIKEYLNGEEIQKVLPEVMGPEFINEQSFNKIDDGQAHLTVSQDQSVGTTIQPQFDNQAVNPNIISSLGGTENFSPAVQSIMHEQKKQDNTSPLPIILVVAALASIIAAFIFFVL